jgi:hypothetical protein
LLHPASRAQGCARPLLAGQEPAQPLIPSAGDARASGRVGSWPRLR